MMWMSWGNAWAGMGLALLLAVCFFWPARHWSWSLPIELEPELEARPQRVHHQWGGICQGLALVLMLWAGWRWHLTPATVAACVFIAGTALLAWIDAETGYLPDRLTLPLLWLGLLVNLDHTFTSLPLAVMGAALGYGSLWLLNYVFLLLTGRAGMGHGDFKLLAALGAWLGATALPGMVLSASVLGLLAALLLRLSGRLEAGQAIHFGPYLVLGSWVLLFSLPRIL
ncbi:prepilin peptidase [Alcaligenes parafaecalis]|nr:A24 family peptidase [Alcaligenes parafaecalis]